MREKSFDSINVVPFIDIMLVLLTIVLATATFIKTGAIPVTLPNAESAPTEESKTQPIVITISQEGDLYYENEKTDLDKIRAVLNKLDPKKDVITVWADKKAHIQSFASLMGVLNTRGFERINLQTEIE